MAYLVLVIEMLQKMRLPSNQDGVHSNHGQISFKIGTETKYGTRNTNMVLERRNVVENEVT